MLASPARPERVAEVEDEVKSVWTFQTPTGIVRLLAGLALAGGVFPVAVRHLSCVRGCVLSA